MCDKRRERKDEWSVKPQKKQGRSQAAAGPFRIAAHNTNRRQILRTPFVVRIMLFIEDTLLFVTAIWYCWHISIERDPLDL